MAANLNAGVPSYVPLTFGHDIDPDYQMAMMEAWDLKNALPLQPGHQGTASVGCVRNAVVRDQIMYGDLCGVPTKLAAVIKTKGSGYITCSPTVGKPKVLGTWYGHQGKPVKGPVVLGVALLGAKQPAFTTQAGFDSIADFSSTDDDDDAIYTLDGAFAPSMHRDAPLGTEEEMPETPIGATDPTIHVQQTQHEKYSMNFENIEGGDQKDMNFSKEWQLLANMIAESRQAFLNEIAGVKAQLAAREEADWSTALAARSDCWTHLSAEETVEELATIREMHATNPDGAEAIVKRHDMFAAKMNAQLAADDKKDDEEEEEDDDKKDMSATNPAAVTPDPSEFQSQAQLAADESATIDGRKGKDIVDEALEMAAKMSETNGLDPKDNFSAAYMKVTTTTEGKRRASEQIMPVAAEGVIVAAPEAVGVA